MSKKLAALVILAFINGTLLGLAEESKGQKLRETNLSQIKVVKEGLEAMGVSQADITIVLAGTPIVAPFKIVPADQRLVQAVSDSSCHEFYVQGVGRDDGFNAILGVFGADPRKGARKKSLDDAIEQCSMKGGILVTSNLIGDFGDFNEDKFQVQCDGGGLFGVIVKKESCTALVKAVCRINESTSPLDEDRWLCRSR